MRIDVVTLFPGMVEPGLDAAMLGRARARGLVDIRVVNLRDYAGGKHRITDDYQFGGGGGMVLKPEPLFAAVDALSTPGARVILMDPRARTFTQAVAAELARETHLILLAGRYEGVDARVSERLADDLISIGDYVLTGGELPALVVTDAVARLLPGVLGAEGATERESFASGLLEPPQYTRPEEFGGSPGRAVLRACAAQRAAGASFTVRRISYGVGVERTFPLHSPRIERVEVVRRSRVRRSKLYYLRGLAGKAARLKEKRAVVIPTTTEDT